MAQTFRRAVLTAVLACSLSASAVAAPDPQDADVMYLPTPYPVVDAMLRLADLRPGDRLVDLGAGDGRIAIAAARAYGIMAVGVELDARKVEEARANVRRAGVAHLVEIRQGDVLEADLTGATVVTLFLFPELNARLAPKLRTELPPGARIVSHRFGLGDWPPARQIEALGYPLMLWTVPPR